MLTRDALRRWADRPAAAAVLAALALALAAVGAQPFAGGFNDASRLATTESLVERGTLAIDDSIFVQPPAENPPFPPELPYTRLHGTLDRVRIDGHWYSDKPMVPAVLAAAGYRALMACGLPRPSERPDVFCRTVAILVCGTSAAAAVVFLWKLGERAGLSPNWRLVWIGGFALAGVLPAYTRHVNAGMPQLAAVAGLALMLARNANGERGWRTPIGAGTCAGLGYAIDGGSGPLLLVAAFAAVALRTRRAAPLAAFALAALPWVAAHHLLNYAVGRVWVPLGMVPEYLDWPGSPFDRSNLTGFSRHTPATFVEYGWNLLFGANGFLLFNPPLLLAAAAGGLVFRDRNAPRIELAALCGWCVGTWGLYAGLSDNDGGSCLSIRWFIAFLAPGYWLLAHLLARRPEFCWDFMALAAWGAVIGWKSWERGPWPIGPVFDPRPIAALALGLWIAVRLGLIAARRRGSEARRRTD